MGQGKAGAAVKPGGARFKSAFARKKNRSGSFSSVVRGVTANAKRTVEARRARGLNAAGTRKRPRVR